MSPLRIVVLPEGRYQVQTADGRAPELAELQALTRASGPSERIAAFVVLDESPLADHAQPEAGHVPDLSTFVEPVAPVPLVLGNQPALVVGELTSLQCQAPGSWPETTGRFLLGVAAIMDSPLADAAWAAMRSGLLDSVCPVWQAELHEGRAIWRGLSHVNLVPRADAASVAARMLTLTTA